MEPLLYLVHRIPYPPNKGDKIRSFHILKHLSRRFRVSLGAFIDSAEDVVHASALDAYCEESYLPQLSPWRTKLGSLAGLATGEALTVPYYRHSGMRRWVDKVIAEREITKAVVFSSAMAQYVSAESYNRLLRIIDFVDVDSDKWRQYSASVKWPMSWIYRREGEKLLQYERSVSCAFDHSIFVSRDEAEHFMNLVPHASHKVVHMNNGVDLEYFDPLQYYESPYSHADDVLVFTGAMDYWANANAVIWFVKEVFPLIRQSVGQVRFYIVGSNPGPEVIKLSADEGVYVTGRVADVRPYLAHAAAAVAPLQIARGIQNKVLEAMAMGRPVFATVAAARGLPVRHGRELVISEDARQMAQEIIEYLKSARMPEIAASARGFVEQEFRWEDSLNSLDCLLDLRTELQS